MNEKTLNPSHIPYARQLVDELLAVPVLSSLTAETLHVLDDADRLHVDQGQYLIHQGEVHRKFWILLEGELDLIMKLPDGGEQIVYTQTPGASFGEVPLLANIASTVSMRAKLPSELLELSEDLFWSLMMQCPEVRKAILGNMAMRLAKTQQATFQQEKMASLGTLAAGLMHELNNPGSAARRASAQLRENLLRMHRLTAKFSKTDLSSSQKQCMFDLQEYALSTRPKVTLTTLEQTDAEEALVEWMETAKIEDAWKLAPTLVEIGLDAGDLECARRSFAGSAFSDALSWLEALVSSMQLVGTIEESIGRVTDLVLAVKSYAYEGRGQKQTVDVNQSIHATLVILGHKLREKQVVLDKSLAATLPPILTECQGLNQVWTNLLDNAIDAVPQGGHIAVRTWTEEGASADRRSEICILVKDDGPGIPVECQARIFDPFFTTKPVGVGTGLGLGIVYRIVEQYGGTIHFTSTPGDTEFLVRLPAGAKI